MIEAKPTLRKLTHIQMIDITRKHVSLITKAEIIPTDVSGLDRECGRPKTRRATLLATRKP